jgi:hypothetical protein
VRRRQVTAFIAVTTFLPAAAFAQDAGRLYRIGTVISVPLTDPTIAMVLEELRASDSSKART